MTACEYTRNRRARLKATGLCGDCARRPHKPDSARCHPCASKIAAKRKASLARFAPVPSRYTHEAETLAAIAAELGISHQAVRQTIATALRKIAKACRRLGIDASDVVGKPASMAARLQEWA